MMEWDFNSILMGFKAASGLPRDLAGFESMLQNAPGSFGGVQLKNHSAGPRPAPLLADARVTPASYRKLS